MSSPVFDLVFTAPSAQPPALGPDYYEELRAVPYRHMHTLYFKIGCYRYKVEIVAVYNFYYGRVCGVLSFHIDPLEKGLLMLYPKINLHRMTPFQVESRN